MSTINTITNFRNTTYFLSNMYPCKVTFDGITYGCAEAAFQAQKSLDPDFRVRMSRIDGYAARQQGKKVELRPDWDEVRLGLMGKIVLSKFGQNPELAAQLVNTGDAQIVHENSWGDDFWGTVKGQGKNHLGRILMKVREKLSKVDAPFAAQEEDEDKPPFDVGDDNLIDGVNTPSVNENPTYSERFHDLPADDYSVDNVRGVDNSQARLNEAKANEPAEKKIPAAWLAALSSQKTVVAGYRSIPEEGEHKVRLVKQGPLYPALVRANSPLDCGIVMVHEEYPKFFAATERYAEFMVLLLEDQKTRKQWETSVKLSAVGVFQQNIADENAGRGVGMTLGELLDDLAKTEFRCWTLIDPEQVEKYKNRTFFSAKKYTQVYNAIQKKQEAAKKQQADKK